MNAIDGSIQMIKSGLRVFGFCPAGSTSKVDLSLEGTGVIRE